MIFLIFSISTYFSQDLHNGNWKAGLGKCFFISHGFFLKKQKDSAFGKCFFSSLTSHMIIQEFCLLWWKEEGIIKNDYLLTGNQLLPITLCPTTACGEEFGKWEGCFYAVLFIPIILLYLQSLSRMEQIILCFHSGSEKLDYDWSHLPVFN